MKPHTRVAPVFPLVYGLAVFVNQCARITNSASVEGLGGFRVPYSSSPLLLGSIGDEHAGPGEAAAIGLLITVLSFLVLRLASLRKKDLTRVGLTLTSLVDASCYAASLALSWTVFVWTFMPFWMQFQAANFLGRETVLTNTNLLVLSLVVMAGTLLFHYVVDWREQ